MKVIYDYSRKWFEDYFVSKGLAKFRATQVFEALYSKQVESFDEITNINKEVKAMLSNEFTFESLKVEKIQESFDGTTKFLFKLSDGNLIETVLMVHDYGMSVCVTTQVGCNMGCKFCASGVLKKVRDLSSGEIVLQVLNIDKYLKKQGKRVSHVVVMGIGEPFDNYDNVMEFIKIINDDKGLQIGSRHITVSTCGLSPKIIEFSKLPLQVNLAISLHFSSDEKRSKYMNINRKYNLENLFNAINEYYLNTNRRVTFEYILLDGINDSLEDARKLVDLVKGVNCYVNLIPYNDTGMFKRTSNEKRDKFFDYLSKNHINAIVRKEHGSDIDASCGQLRAKNLKK